LSYAAAQVPSTTGRGKTEIHSPTSTQAFDSQIAYSKLITKNATVRLTKVTYFKQSSNNHIT